MGRYAVDIGVAGDSDRYRHPAANVCDYDSFAINFSEEPDIIDCITRSYAAFTKQQCSVKEMTKLLQRNIARIGGDFMRSVNVVRT